MREIELRLALVFYGGVSLAIYMHGVSREILSLVRACASRAPKPNRPFTPEECRALSPSEKAYAALLEAVGETVRLRVVVDAIAGASAGGVNGVMLARAIAHDLPLDSHRDLWLKHADVTELARPQDGLTRYLKSGVSPVLNRVISSQLNRQITEPETREKLRLFMQSRWFTPPFSGEAYISWMLDAYQKMEEGAEPGATLIPQGQALDLFVTITDYHGRCRKIRIDDPAFIEEWDHRRILNFKARHRATGDLESELDSRAAPELVFAARATSSFPGAFPPATIAEMDKVLDERGEIWPNREKFLKRRLELTGEKAAHHCFVDGSVVMNKPFAPVIEVVRQRPATREVARRLVYVDPVPVDRKGAPNDLEELPGFFRVILASLAHIPRNEPVGDDLMEIEAGNRRSRWLAHTISAVDPVAAPAVRKILPLWGRMKPETMSSCREKANAMAHEQAGYAYLNYQSQKLHAISDSLAALLRELANPEPDDTFEYDWVGLINGYLDTLSNLPGGGNLKPSPAIIHFLKQFDVDYRIRRLRFTIRRLNSFYQERAALMDGEGARIQFDQLKSRLYEQIDLLQARWTGAFFEPEVSDAARNLAEVCQTGTEGARLGALVVFLKMLAGQMRLPELDAWQDEILSDVAAHMLEGDWYKRLIEAYIGYAFYDLVIFPGLQGNDFAEVGETLVDRISPKDATSLQEEGFELKGKALNTFGAFFNRSWREHDYLWGRLNTAERLISIVLSASDDIEIDPDRLLKLKHDIFRAILDEERPYLRTIGAEMDTVERKIEAMATAERVSDPVDYVA
ncbi:patatin-like protein [Roseibium sediminis]|uniref:patatin-like protein n=1 Tax=Roseibium sediminis TaxID=1775174 RepID=UPI00123E3BE0|nr:patatin-like protein [Roseibium sediminis]